MGQSMTERLRQACVAVMLLLLLTASAAAQQPRTGEWRQATGAELRSVIPARAPVVTERIETDMTSAAGITDGRGKFIAEAVLITAGYSAEGRYSRFFLTQVPLRLGSDVRLTPGEYVIGYERSDKGLYIHFFEAATGRPAGTVLATRIANSTRVESFRIWLPSERSAIQIGRFSFTYQIGG